MIKGWEEVTKNLGWNLCKNIYYNVIKYKMSRRQKIEI